MDYHQLLPAISTFFITISAILVAIGWALIIKGKQGLHKRTMLAAAVAALLFFIIYMYRTLCIGNTSWGGPDDLKRFYFVFLLFHIVLATVAAVFGLVTLYTAFRSRFKTHRRLGRITSLIWFATAITGLTVYSLLYVLYPGGHTKPVIDVILGR